jgi:hypothetical protein
MTDLSKRFPPNSTFYDARVRAARAPDAEPDEAQAVEQRDVPETADDLPAPDCDVPVAPQYGSLQVALPYDGPQAQDYESLVLDYGSLVYDSPPVHAWPLVPHYDSARYSVCWTPSHAKDWLSYSPDDTP